MSKGKGWHNDRYEHKLASKGVSVAYDYNLYSPKYTANGQMLPSEGIKDWLKGVGSKFKQGYRKLRYGKEGAQVVNKAERKAKEAKLEAKRAKANTKAAKLKNKELRELKKARDMSQFEEQQEAKDVIRAGPVDEDFEIEPGGRTKTLMDEMAKETHNVPREEMFDTDMDIIESVDADAIIKVAEEKEKLINFNVKKGKYIGLLRVESKAKEREFNLEERSLANSISNDKKLARAKLDTKIRNIKMTGMSKENMIHQINEAKNDYETEFRGKENILRETKMQHHADIDFIKNAIKKHQQVYEQIDNRIKVMTASGIKE